MASAARPISAAKILFIGNSLTARNNLPELIANQAAAGGRSVEHRLISVGGASLRTHWNAGEATRAIQKGHFDFVVLQEQSTLPVKNAQRMHENVRLFDGVIKSSSAKSVLYMTWARQHAPETQQLITDAYTSIGRELDATVVPVGSVWQSFLKKNDQPLLYDKDGSHPTLAGSYLAACVFLATLFKQDPVGIESEVAGLNGKDRLLLQKSAWLMCKANASDQRRSR